MVNGARRIGERPDAALEALAQRPMGRSTPPFITASNTIRGKSWPAWD
jgi:hypothetical protein